jgi:hypothetical protein
MKIGQSSNVGVWHGFNSVIIDQSVIIMLIPITLAIIHSI